jgi:hypothetical protein
MKILALEIGEKGAKARLKGLKNKAESVPGTEMRPVGFEDQ